MRFAYFDTDDTLVLWTKPKAKTKKLLILDPSANKYRTVWSHEKHIAILKLIREHGDIVVVWSAAGASWARAVVKALGLEPYVTYCLQKPDTIYDDEPTSKWLSLDPKWKTP